MRGITLEFINAYTEYVCAYNISQGDDNISQESDRTFNIMHRLLEIEFNPHDDNTSDEDYILYETIINTLCKIERFYKDGEKVLHMNMEENLKALYDVFK